MIRLLESKPFLFFFRIICGRLWGSLAIEDHLRSRDHLRYCTELSCNYVSGI